MLHRESLLKKREILVIPKPNVKSWETERKFIDTVFSEPPMVARKEERRERTEK
jgi:hypothetical protein